MLIDTGQLGSGSVCLRARGLEVPACARSEIVAKGEVRVYHCWSRCVWRAFLCGRDSLSGIDYEYRRSSIVTLQQTLARLFGVGIAFHAELSNHIHIIVRTRPDVVDNWSDQQVVRRWLIIAKLKRRGTYEMVEPTQKELDAEMADAERVATLR